VARGHRKDSCKPRTESLYRRDRSRLDPVEPRRLPDVAGRCGSSRLPSGHRPGYGSDMSFMESIREDEAINAVAFGNFEPTLRDALTVGRPIAGR
jgi:hypothetical protein